MSVRFLFYDKSPELRSIFTKLIECTKDVKRPQINNAEIQVLQYDPLVPFADVVKNTGVDAIVSPGNSFGFMNGGFDAAISKYYASVANTSQDEITLHVQRMLKEKVGGYNPPTNAVILNMAAAIATPNAPHLVHVPTMALPHRIPAHTPTIFNCMWSVIHSIKAHNGSVSTCEGVMPIESVLLSGLGTGVGDVPPTSCATQIMTALQLFNQPLVEEHDQRGGMSMGVAAQMDTLIERSCK